MIRIRRVTASVGAAALAMGALVALGAPSGATPAAQPAVASATVGVNGLCGGVVTQAIPPDLAQGHSESNKLRLFREQLNYTTAGAIPVDFVAPGLYDEPSDIVSPKPSVPSGSHVNSYILHSDPIGSVVGERHLRAATIGFTSDVVGVQVLSATITEAQADQLHAVGTHYPNATSGLELVDGGTADIARVVNKRTVSVAFKTSNAVDEIRIITKATTSEATALKGYRMLAADGGVFDFGGQQFYGSTGGRVLNKPVVAGVNTCSNAGYWFVASDGGVFSYGDAIYHGSLGGFPLASPVVGMAATPTGAGYYLVTAKGEVHIFGDARVFNNAAGHHDLSYLKTALNKPIVGMAASASGRGYWLVASDGGIFAFGDAAFYGSTGNIHLVSPIIGMFAAIDGLGYYMYAADGGMFTFQRHPPCSPATHDSCQVHEPFFGSAGGAVRAHPIVGARLAADGNGYWFDDSAGVVYAFGPSAPKATPRADMSGVALFRPMIGMM